MLTVCTVKRVGDDLFFKDLHMDGEEFKARNEEYIVSGDRQPFDGRFLGYLYHKEESGKYYSYGGFPNFYVIDNIIYTAWYQESFDGEKYAEDKFFWLDEEDTENIEDMHTIYFER